VWDFVGMKNFVVPLTALAFAGAGMLMSGCAHAPVSAEIDPRTLLGQACQAGANVTAVKGSVWLKAKSKEASGQFPANVDAPAADRLKLEVTNLMGGTEAILTVEGRHYKIQVPNKKGRDEHGESSWGGIPLQWANALFLGKIPCPDSVLAKDAVLSKGGEGELIVETPKTLDRLPEKFVYRFRSFEGMPWAESLRWERKGIAGSAPVTVEFKFEDPEAKTRSPQKWEAKGAQGEVKVRWKDRQAS
jgi:hypothetical protein